MPEMPVPITALYLAVFAVFSGYLAFLPGKIRGSSGISIGDGGRPDLLLAMRRHANFVEFVPLLLIMFGALELNGASPMLLHGLGSGLLVARICHAVGIKADTIQSPARGIGAGGTLVITLIAAAVLVYQFVGSLDTEPRMWIALTLLAIVAVTLVVAGIFLDAPDHSRYDEPGHELMKPPEAISAQHKDTVATVTAFNRNGPGPTQVAESRRHFEEMFGREIDAEITPIEVDGVPGEWVRADGSRTDQRLLYLHGGAFRIGSPKSHRGMTETLSRLTGVSVLAIDYRLLPENRLLHCHEDARTAYRWMLENGPDGASEAMGAYVAGDSAGGNLTLALSAWLRDQRLRLPDAAVAMAPGTDGTLSSPSWRANRPTDPFLGPSLGRVVRMPRAPLLIAMTLMNRVRPNDPLVSPLLGDLSGLPPTLIQVSEQELLFDDSRRYANKAREAGSPVTLQVWPKLVHVFQGFAPDLPEANEALASIAAFIEARMAATLPGRAVVS